jgi:hypothetical protein
MNDNEKDQLDIIENVTKLKGFFNEYVKLIYERLLKFNEEKDPPYYKVIYQNILERLYYGIEAINTLMDRFIAGRSFKYPIGIQMRTCLLDSITAAYLYLNIKE